MATKTISVDLAAYDRLCAARRGNESFSEVIKRVVRGNVDIGEYLYRMENNPMSGKTAAAVREHVESRHVPRTRRR
jgi:predicted CopG family antitoxin